MTDPRTPLALRPYIPGETFIIPPPNPGGAPISGTTAEQYQKQREAQATTTSVQDTPHEQP